MRPEEGHAAAESVDTGSRWLTIIGIGEDGIAGLSSAARKTLAAAEVLVGGDRHHDLAAHTSAERIRWPSPFDALIETLRSHRNRRIVVLATGDPLWYSVGARIVKEIPAAEIAFYPQLSAFQWASCRMGWSLADIETMTAHGRPVEQVIPFFWPGARLLILTAGSHTPGEIAHLLTARGFGASEMTVLANLGGSAEQRLDGIASDWAAETPEVPPFHTLAVACQGRPDRLLSRLPGLPDDAFTHDGKMTKRDLRALALSRLMPGRGELLWDIGTGCGSISVEWMRAARDALAIGIDTNPDRLAMARENATRLGTPKLELVEGTAPAVLEGLSVPDAVFLGGGIGAETAEKALSALGPNGRLVAHAVTLESEAVLLKLFATHGGELTRHQVTHASPVGHLTGWRPAMPVTQWSLVK